MLPVLGTFSVNSDVDEILLCFMSSSMVLPFLFFFILLLFLFFFVISLEILCK